MQAKKIIVIPTDFSQVCDNAIHHGAEMARNLDYKVCLLHVIDSNTKAELRKENKGPESIEQRLEAIAGNYRNEFGVEVEYVIREGGILTEIPEAARELNADLMILGTHGKKGIQHVTGSYAFKVVTAAPCPTIVVQNRSFGEGYRNIVFPIKEIDYVRQKVQWAIKVAKTFHATIQIFVVDSKVESIKRGLHIVTKQIEEVLRKFDVEYSIVQTKENNFTRRVLKYAGSNRSDMILIMSKMYLFDYNIAPSEEKLFFNDAEIPVMCINPVELNQYRFSI